MKRPVSIVPGVAALMLAAAAAMAQTPAPAPCQLRVSTEPAGAVVRLDGIVHDQTPLALANIEPGTHLLVVTRPGYREGRRTVELAAGQRVAVDLALEPVTGLVLVHSTPSGAEVTVDGAHRGATPLLVTDLSPGGYRLAFTLGGYLPREIDLAVEDRTPQRVAVSLVSDSATLMLGSEPGGADVILNGISRPATPCTLDRVSAGENELRIVLEGYRPFARTLKLEAGQIETVMAELEPIPAELSVVSMPSGARIYLDDQFRGEAPVTIGGLGPGTYELRAELPGYDAASVVRTLSRAERRTEEFRLQSNSGSLEVISHPPGVTVLIDGRDSGTTRAEADDARLSDPLRIDLVPVGSRRVQLTKKGFFPKTVTVEIRRQEITPLQESLKRRFIPDTEIKTAADVFRGILLEEDVQGNIRLEIRPGIIKTIPAADIVSRERISEPLR